MQNPLKVLEYISVALWSSRRLAAQATCWADAAGAVQGRQQDADQQRDDPDDDEQLDQRESTAGFTGVAFDPGRANFQRAVGW